MRARNSNLQPSTSKPTTTSSKSFFHLASSHQARAQGVQFPHWSRTTRDTSTCRRARVRASTPIVYGVTKDTERNDAACNAQAARRIIFFSAGDYPLFPTPNHPDPNAPRSAQRNMMWVMIPTRARHDALLLDGTTIYQA